MWFFQNEYRAQLLIPVYRRFLQWWVSPTTMGFPTKKWSFWGVKWGYHHLRKHPYWDMGILETFGSCVCMPSGWWIVPIDPSGNRLSYKHTVLSGLASFRGEDTAFNQEKPGSSRYCKISAKIGSYWNGEFRHTFDTQIRKIQVYILWICIDHMYVHARWWFFSTPTVLKVNKTQKSSVNLYGWSAGQPTPPPLLRVWLTINVFQLSESGLNNHHLSGVG